MGLMGHQLDVQTGRVVQPTHSRGVVAEGKYVVVGFRLEALEPDIDRHGDELEKVVDQGAAV
jgi:hypothetical protein